MIKILFQNIQSTEIIFEQTLNEESSGILVLSVDDINVQQRSKIFADQLAEKRITENSVFYFEFDDFKIQAQFKVPTFKDYLGIQEK